MILKSTSSLERDGDSFGARRQSGHGHFFFVPPFCLSCILIVILFSLFSFFLIDVNKIHSNRWRVTYPDRENERPVDGTSRKSMALANLWSTTVVNFYFFFILSISNVAPNWWILPFLLLIPFAGLSLSYFFWKIFVGMRRWMPIHLTNIFSPLPFSGKDKRRHELYCSFLFCYLTIFRGWRLCDIILASLFRPLFHIYYTVFYSETIAALCVCVCGCLEWW
jgi:hypothetical protein